jgi:uncharacterized membrane protein YeaQ/YmgE (transglycosylase-associated protein family)
MFLLAWIFMDVLVGWGAGRLLEGNGYGPFMDVAMGIGGAVAGGFLMRSVGFTGYGGMFFTVLVAMLGAVLLTLLTGYFNGRRVFARKS